MVSDKNKVTVRWILDQPRRRRWWMMTGKNRGRLQGVLLGVTASAAIAAAWSLPGLKLGEFTVNKPVAGVSREREAEVRTPAAAPELQAAKRLITSAPIPSPAHNWPGKSFHLPAAYHQAGHAVMSLVLGVRIGEIKLEKYKGCATCHSPGVDCLTTMLFISSLKDSALIHTAGWAAAKLFGHAGSFENLEGLDSDSLTVDAQSRELGLSIKEIKQETLRILSRPNNRRAIDAIAKQLAATGAVRRDEAERIYAELNVHSKERTTDDERATQR